MIMPNTSLDYNDDVWNITAHYSMVGDINISLTYTVEGTQNDTEENVLYPVSLVIPITVIYAIIFFTGLLGNVSTCIVIARNKSMHTATNYYLFSLAISDLLLLVSGLPPEMYRIWSPETYVFGEAFCILQGFAAETSANATVLTITAFTVERYLAICHPFLSHTISKLSRVVKYVIIIWIAALCLAAPQAIQFGVEYEEKNGMERSRCTVVSNYFQHAFEISTFLFFVGPMTLITVLYVLIAVKLHKSRLLAQKRTSPLQSGNGSVSRAPRTTAAQKRVIKMLVAVVVAFFLCWAPFHAQRLLAVYLSTASVEAQNTFISFYIVLMYTSGVLYFVSTTINPVLYHIMSKKFREAFKATFMQICRGGSIGEYDRRMYSSLLRNPQSFKTFPKITNNGIKPPSSCDCSSNKDVSLENADGNCLETSRNCAINPKDQQDTETPFCEMVATSDVFRTRISSETSQITVLTNLSKTTPAELIHKHHQHHQTQQQQRLLKNNQSNFEGRQSSFIVDLSKNRSNKTNNILSYNMFRLFANKKTHNNNNNTFIRQGSVESGHSTNTISNSSLQDMDESEFNSSELAQYMEEINHGLA